MSEALYRDSDVKDVIDEVNTCAKNVEIAATELVTKVNEIASSEIVGMEWYQGTFSKMLNNIQNNRAAYAAETIRSQADKLRNVGIEVKDLAADNQ